MPIRNEWRAIYVSEDFWMSEFLLSMSDPHNRDNLAESLDVNVFSVHRVTKKFLPLLKMGQEKKVVNM